MMDYLVIIFCVLLGLGVTLLLIPLIRHASESGRGYFKASYFHHTHQGTISRLGGGALAVAFVAVAAASYLGLIPHDPAQRSVRTLVVCAPLAMFLLGLWDDLKPLGARKKLVGQILIAAAVCYAGVGIENFQNPVTGTLYSLGKWSWLVTIGWLVALTNVINLCDGIDGLAGGISLMLMGLLTFLGGGDYLPFPVACAAGMFGALLGFLRYNFPPAKIYMGDGGAYFLGFLIALLTLLHSQKGSVVAALIAPLFVLALPILDVSVAILRRGLKGLPIFRPDREHIHHRLLKFGFSRTRTVLVMYGISALFLFFAFILLWLQGRGLPILMGFIFLTLLLAGRSFDFSRHWFAVGRVLENSLELRKETHYALALGRWLELEAERVDTPEELWEGFIFVARKLGFVRVTLRLADVEKVWEREPAPVVPPDYQCTYDWNGNHPVALRLEGDTGMSVKMFEHLSELAAEAWLKAAVRWQEANNPGAGFRFKPAGPA
jgi:UDP-GlcNAc:undecaprenyl-phosphate/decaprenyl-phosphate GlcNAc-1-phosphate transferase